MGLGIKEPILADGAHTPGTSILFERPDHDARGVKHAAGKNSGLILVPQPSKSPNDPLNWPLWKKDLAFFAICFNVALGAVLSPVLSTAGGDIVKEFHITFSQYALLTGWPLLTSGCAACLSQTTSRIWGKRSTYIIATLLLFTTSIWNSRVTTYNEFVAARVVEGFGNGPFESIVLSSIGDLYFVHQRGKRIMFYNLVTLGVVTFSPIVGGYITQMHGWRTQFYVIAGFLFLGLLLLIFACPEHVYNRPIEYETDVIALEPQVIKESDKKVELTANDGAADEPMTYWQELRPFGSRISRQNPLLLLARPFACMLYPAVVWAFLVGGCWSTWNAGIVITLAQLFSTPPNLFTPSKLGYVFTFPFLGAIAAVALGSLMADSTAKWGARRNKGVFESEYRMWLVIPAFIVGIPGLFAFGAYGSERNINWVLVSFIYGLILFGTVFSSAAAFAYILDSHRNLSAEVSVAFVMLRNFFWFGASYFIPGWLEGSGPAVVFEAMGGIQTAISVLSILAYVYGKVSRKFIQRHDPLKFLGLL